MYCRSPAAETSVSDVLKMMHY